MVNLEGHYIDRLADAGSDSVSCAAETAECGCPDRCDRDHSNE